MWGLAIALYCALFIPATVGSVMLISISTLSWLVSAFAGYDGDQGSSTFFIITAILGLGTAFLLLMLPGTAAAWAITRRFWRGLLHGLWTVIPTAAVIIVLGLLWGLLGQLAQ